MLLEAFAELMSALVEAAVDDHDRVTVDHVGDPARYLVLDRASGVIVFQFMADGDRCRLPRSCRLLIEPVDSVAMRSLLESAQRWSTQ